MELVITREVIIDHVLKFVPLRQKLRLRTVNGNSKNAVESWLKRYHRRLDLRGPTKQTIKLISLVPKKLDVLVVSVKPSDELWKAVNPKLYSARDLCFELFREEFLAWHQRITYAQLRCKSVVFGSLLSFEKTDLDVLLVALNNCSQLKSITFQGGDPEVYLRCLARAPAALLPKIKQVGGQSIQVMFRIHRECSGSLSAHQ